MMKIKFIDNIKPKPKKVGEHYLFASDCIKILKQIPKNSIKLVVTDPPYNIGLSYNKFIHQLKEKNINLDRKILSQLAKEKNDVFEKIVEEVKK